jgi:hypothetical protein
VKALRWGLLFGAGIAAANLVLQFVVTPFVPWQLVGALSVGAWLAGLAAAGVFAGTRSLLMGASGAVTAAAVDLVRSVAVAIVVGVPAVQSSPLQGSPTPGMIIAETLVEFLLLLGPIAAGVGFAAARVSRRSPSAQTVMGD